MTATTMAKTTATAMTTTAMTTTAMTTTAMTTTAMTTTAMTTLPTGTPTRGSVLGLLEHARRVLAEAESASEPGERFRLGHLSALRTAAAVCAGRSRPASTRRRLMNVWVLLERVAPEYESWAAYFAAGASLRTAVEAGAVSAVSVRAGDDQVRAASEFLALVEQSLGLLAA